MFFYGFILVQFGAIDFIIKGLRPGGIYRLDLFIRPLLSSRKL